ncbi:GTP cyclohydrolase FolE2 [Desulfonatronum thioautotrophicum]|uniref:GTP cyclohydrolase FolE2 n=1 Tax=Desulfonatronum thioautotrophicum TaxID=617001 RepID=UPI0005EBE96F|nr:GTP cyclohydrolase FolE2 [Desulfonatronum thioautotrophicum]
MQDIQSEPASIPVDIDRVGIRHVHFPLVVLDRAQGRQHTVAQVEMGVDLPAEFKGTHMSRFVEALQAWSGVLDYPNLKHLLGDVQNRLDARKAWISFCFPFFLEQAAPVSGSRSRMDYQCRVVGEYQDGTLLFGLEVEVPVMTVCPCSLAICDRGAHSQRAMVRIRTRNRGLIWLEDLIDLAQESASSPVYALLKREDEKRIIDDAFEQPCFVEDVVRNASRGLERLGRLQWYRVEVESQESIHNHSAYARIERSLPRDSEK